MAFDAWKWPRGKAGPLADIVHRQADVHAYVNPQIRTQVPTTVLQLAEIMGDISTELRVEAERLITARYKAGVPTKVQYEQFAAEMAAMAAEYNDMIGRHVADSTVNAYGTGMAQSTMYLMGEGVGGMQQPGTGFAVSFSKPHRSAMEALVNDYFTDLAGQTRYMTQNAVRILRTSAGALIRHELARGTNPRYLSRQIEGMLASKGFTPSDELKRYVAARDKHKQPGGSRPQQRINTLGQAAGHSANWGETKFVDKAGREWDLRKYSEMLARTKLSIAQNEGQANTCVSAGVNHYRVSDHATESEICNEYEGNIYWFGRGKALGYDEAPTLPPYHPNCLHYILPHVMT